MQYLCNQWSDFKNSWGCLILTLLSLWSGLCTTGALSRATGLHRASLHLLSSLPRLSSHRTLIGSHTLCIVYVVVGGDVDWVCVQLVLSVELLVSTVHLSASCLQPSSPPVSSGCVGVVSAMSVARHSLVCDIRSLLAQTVQRLTRDIDIFWQVSTLSLLHTFCTTTSISCF